MAYKRSLGFWRGLTEYNDAQTSFNSWTEMQDKEETHQH